MGLFSTTLNGSNCDVTTASPNLVRVNNIFSSHVNIEGVYVTRYHSVSLETIGKYEWLIE